MSRPGWLRAEAGAVVVTVRLTPKADRDAADGLATLSDDREVLKVRVRAVPEDGAANRALIDVIAKGAGVPKSAVSVVSGQTRRVKQVRVAGDPAELTARIVRLAEGRRPQRPQA